MKNFPPGSWIIIDDFRWIPSTQERSDFNYLVNFTLRHVGLTLCIVVHNLQLSKLFSEINLCSNIFLTFSNQSKKYLVLQGKAYKHFLTFFNRNQLEKYTISYFSNIRDIFVANVHPLLNSTAPFKKTYIMVGSGGSSGGSGGSGGSKEYVIHSSNMPCDAQAIADDPPSPATSPLLSEMVADYPKKKRLVKLIQRTLSKFINDDLFVHLGNHSMHIYDVVSLFLTPIKRHLTSSQIKFLKQMKLLGIKWPMTACKNPQVRKLIF